MDPYQVLGVPRGATAVQIRRAFHDAARRVHPDTGGSVPDAGTELARLVWARDLLLAAPNRQQPTGNVTAFHRRRGLSRWWVWWTQRNRPSRDLR